MSDYASQAGHFYDRDGTPRYTYINKKGVEKPTTLREARKYNWWPGYSNVAALAAKPGLIQWMQEQLILACLTLPKIEEESEADYIKRIKEDAKAQAKKAAERGTEIHGYIEKGFKGDFQEGSEYIDSVMFTINAGCGLQEWSTEKSFAFNGYGGKVDLHNNLYLIDFKTTDKPLDNVKLWDEHYMQLAAYNYGLAKYTCGVSESLSRRCGICYIHRDTAESKLIWAEKNNIDKGWKCFLSLLDYYFAKTGLER